MNQKKAFLTIYKKKNCHLCDEMKADLKAFQNEYSFEIEEIDIESDEKLIEKYKEKIPVLLVNGKIFAKYRLDVKKLRNKLEILNLNKD